MPSTDATEAILGHLTQGIDEIKERLDSLSNSLIAQDKHAVHLSGQIEALNHKVAGAETRTDRAITELRAEQATQRALLDAHSSQLARSDASWKAVALIAAAVSAAATAIGAVIPLMR